MKITQATLRDLVPGLTTRMFSAEKGHGLEFEAGLLHIRAGEGLWLIPLSNVVSMRAEDQKAGKK